MLKKLLFLVLTTVATQFSYGQQVADMKTPKIIPPSPDAAALGKYGQIPVDKSTGIPSIDIPIYEIKTPRFKLPISLSYHASGLKVEEMASWVGAGWVLNAGGMITRTILGVSDDYPAVGYITNTAKTASQIQWPGDIQYIANVLQHRMDTNPDNFFYNFGNQAGSFVFGPDKKPALIPYKPLIINFTSANKNFDITDENGDLYHFNTKEQVISNISPTYFSGISTWYLTQMVSADRSDTLNFTYTKDSTAANQIVDYSYNFTRSIGPNDAGGYEWLQPFEPPTKPFRTFYPIRINGISFNGGKVEFIPKGNRKDHGNTSLDSVIVYNQDPINKKKYTRIRRFKVQTDYFYGSGGLSYERTPVQDIDRYRLKLTGLQELGSDNTVIKSHQFGYYTKYLPPHIHSFAQDKWGYYNGIDSNRSLLEYRIVTLNPTSVAPMKVEIGMYGTYVGKNGPDMGANRSTSLDYMQAGVLNQITYPTGGYTKLNYDCHKYMGTITTTKSIGAIASSGTLQDDTITYTPTDYMLGNGGNTFKVSVVGSSNLTTQPSVKIIRDVDKVELFNSTTYLSNFSYNGTIKLLLSTGVTYRLIASAHGNATTAVSASISTSYPVDSLAVANAGGLRISSIQNYNTDGSIASTETYAYGNNDESGLGFQLAIPPTYINPKQVGVYYEDIDFNCKIDFVPRTYYTNNSVYPLSTLSGSPVAYPTVTVYHGATSQTSGETLLTTGKSIYTYKIYADSVAVFGPLVDQTKPISVMWKNGEPIRERHFRNNGNNIYSLVQDIANDFYLIPKKKGLGSTIGYTAELLDFPFDRPEVNGTTVQDGQTDCGWWIPWVPGNFYWFDYPVSAGIRVLKQSTNTLYGTDGTSLTTTTKYRYGNPKHMFPTRITTYNSQGDSLIKIMSYPQDIVNAGKDTLNIYNSMVSNNILKPVIEQYQLKNTTQLLYERNAYSNVNAVMYKPASLKIQELSNSIQTRLQYLKYDNKGNLTSVVKDAEPKMGYHWGYKQKYPIAEVQNAGPDEFYYEGFEENASGSLGTAHTGQYYYASANYTVNWTLPNSRNYVISYWYLTAGVWKYKAEQNFTGSAILNTGSGYDDIRIYPKDAQMKTYTYTPQIGITSETNAGSLTIYYQYDNAGRLLDLRDQDGNIVKTYQYNYKQ